MDKTLSVIIPLYNEAKRLNIAFAEILGFNDLKLFSQVEYIFVNDGSTDQSADLINNFIGNHPEIKARLISYSPNAGKGNAVKTGMLAAAGDYLLMADTDMSTPLLDVAKFIPALESGARVIIGSRKSADSNLTKKQPWLRQQIGNIYSFISQSITGLWQIKDFGCGFKLFEAVAAKSIFEKVQTAGWVFDVEVLLLAQKMKYRIKQVGVTWSNDEDSRVNLRRELPKLIGDMIKLRFKHSDLPQKTVAFAKQDLRPIHFFFIFLISAAIIICRRPDMILYPQFWAEDGYWLSQAYQGPLWLTFLTPIAGYLQTISRLIAALALLFPLKFAPLIFNLTAIAIKILPILFLFSKRMKKAVPNLAVKIIIAAAYLVLPNTAEIYANITNAQWHLAILSLLIFLALPAKTIGWRIFDYAVIILGCLSGPFCLFLTLPVAATYFWPQPQQRRGNRWLYAVFGLLTILHAAIIARFVFIGRMAQEYRYSLHALNDLIGGQVVIGALLGEKGYRHLFPLLFSGSNYIKMIIIAIISLIGVSIILYSLIKGNKELRIFIIFCLITFIFSLLKPMVPVSAGESQWQVMALPAHATRYFFLPMLALVLSIMFMALSRRGRLIRIIGSITLLVFFVSAGLNFIYHPWPDFHYTRQIEAFEKIPIGSEANIYIMPAGYVMKLIKK